MIAEFQKLLEFVFSSFWIWLGCFLLLRMWAPFRFNFNFDDRLVSAFKKAKENK